MGILSAFSGKDAKKGASKAAKYQTTALQQAQAYEVPAYQQALASIDPTTAATRDWLTQGKDSVLGAYGSAYDASRGDITTGRDTALNRMESAYGVGLSGINKALQSGLALYNPYITAGSAGLGRVSAMTTPGDTSFQADPGYQWRVNQGQAGIQNSAAARGGVLGGNTLKAIEDYRQGQASQEYGNVYNRNLGLAQMGLSASSGAAGLNQWAGGQNAGLAQWLGGNQAQAYTQAGTNLSNLAQQYGGQQASTLGSYYDTNANLEQQAASQRNQLALAQAQMQAGYATNIGNVQAQRETTQGQASTQGSSNLLGMAGTIGGAALGGSALGNSIGSTLGRTIGGYLGGLTSSAATGYGSGLGGYTTSSNPYLTGSIYR